MCTVCVHVCFIYRSVYHTIAAIRSRLRIKHICTRTQYIRPLHTCTHQHSCAHPANTHSYTQIHLQKPMRLCADVNETRINGEKRRTKWNTHFEKRGWYYCWCLLRSLPLSSSPSLLLLLLLYAPFFIGFEIVLSLSYVCDVLCSTWFFSIKWTFLWI